MSVAHFFPLALRFALLTLAILLLAKVLPRMEIARPRTTLAVAAVYALLNWFASMLLLVLTLPLLFLQPLVLGLVTVGLNALLLKITDLILSGFKISGPLTVLTAAIVITICEAFTSWIF